jgi:hypothetical protein
MKRLAWLAAAAAFALPAGTATATPSTVLTVTSGGSVLDRSTIHPGPGNGTAEAELQGGTFAASGAIDGSGAVTLDVMFSGASANGDVVHGSAAFTTAAGSFTLQFQALHQPFENPVFDGSWVLVDGTGAYAGMHGTGTVEFTIHGELGPNPVVDALWAGSAHA